MSAAVSGALFMNPPKADPGLYSKEYTPAYDDYLDPDDHFDFEDADLGGDTPGALPGDGEVHEKRKSRDESAGTPEHDSKRQETNDGEKAAKKPGRKPLTSEPTTVSVGTRRWYTASDVD
jgi:AP-1-like factor